MVLAICCIFIGFSELNFIWYIVDAFFTTTNVIESSSLEFLLSSLLGVILALAAAAAVLSVHTIVFFASSFF